MLIRASFVLCLLLPSVSWAEGDSGNDYERGCRMVVIGQDPADHYEAAKVGQCMGAIRAVIFLNDFIDPKIRYCPPAGATTGQHIRVVLKYMGAHPEQMQKDIVHISMLAFNEAWPCHRPN